MRLPGRTLQLFENGRRLGTLDRTASGLALAYDPGKTALLFADDVWRLPLGFTPTTHILKPQIGPLPGVDFSRSVENEFLCLSAASAFGLEVAPARIADFGEVRVLVVERFDRRWTDDGRLLRVPHEDLAQALAVPAGRKYELDGGPGMTRLLGLLEGSVSSGADRRSFLRAQIVFWLLAAIDGHAKNYSLRLLPGGRFRLAPLYDVVSVQPALGGDELPAAEALMSLAVGNAGLRAVAGIELRHFVVSGRTAGVPARVVRGLFAELVETRAGAFETVRAGLPNDFPPAMAAAVFDAITGRLQRIERYLAG